MAEPAHQAAQLRERESDHAARRPLDPLDERACEAVDREPAGKLERLARRDVGFELRIGDVRRERDARGVDAAGGGKRCGIGGGLGRRAVDEPVPRVQHARLAAVALRALERDLGEVRLAEDLAAEEEHGVATEHEPAAELRDLTRVAAHHVLRLEPAEVLGELRRGERSSERRLASGDLRLLVDLRREAHRFDASAAEHGEAGGRGRGEDEAHADQPIESAAARAVSIPPGHGRMIGMSEQRNSTPLEIGAEIELEVTGIAHGGVSVARHEGRVVFVADAIPGERVLARVTDQKKKSFARAATTQVLSASADRRDHVWAEAALERDPADRAGGAEFGHIALERQRVLKAEVLVDAMARFGDIELAAEDGEDFADTLAELVEPAPGDDETNGLGYRSRVRLHVDPETGAVGPYAARSRRVIPVESLPLATEGVNQIAPLLEQMGGIATVDLIDPAADDPRMLLTEPGAKTRSGEGDLVRELVEDRQFVVRAGGFWQVHREAPAVLFTAVRDTIEGLIEAGSFDPGAANLDLYGGAGLLAAAMAEAAGPGLKVTTVEAEPAATDDAAENLAELVGALAVTAKVDRHLSDLLKASAPVRDRLRRGTVVLDPPRSGAGGGVTGQLVELSPANIVYVACDPVALARDTKSLLDAGYDLLELRAFDIFPHTHHFESLAVFSRE